MIIDTHCLDIATSPRDFPFQCSRRADPYEFDRDGRVAALIVTQRPAKVLIASRNALHELVKRPAEFPSRSDLP